MGGQEGPGTLWVSLLDMIFWLVAATVVAVTGQNRVREGLCPSHSFLYRQEPTCDARCC
jgi:hypothetical protein